MNIVITYDSSVASAPAAFKTVVADVVKYFDSQFQDPITVNIDVGWGEVQGSPISAGALGESVSNLDLDFTYAQVKSALTALATTPSDKSAVASLPASDPTSGGDFALTTAEAKALGLISPSSATDGWVGFDQTATYAYLTSNTGGTVASGAYDLFAVVAHEISEVLGRQMNFGVSFGPGTGHVYEPLDLFDFTASGVRSFSGPTSGRYFSVNNGTTNLDPYSADPGGDRFDWASGAGNDAFDAFSNPGVVNTVGAADLTLLNLLGYTPTPDFTASGPHLRGATLVFAINDIALGAAAASTAGVELSKDSTINTADTHLIYVSTPTIAAGRSAVASGTVILPSSLAPGAYFLGEIANVNGKVAEANSANNASPGLAVTVVDSSNIATISGVAAALAFDVAGASLASSLTLSGSLALSAAPSGSQTVTIAGGDLALTTGASLTLSKVSLTAATSSFTDLANVSYAGALVESAGSVIVGAGDTLTLTGKGDSFAGTLSAAGHITFGGGTDLLSSTTMAGTVVINGATVTLVGADKLSGVMDVTSAALRVASTGATLSGGGSLVLTDAATNLIRGTVGAAVLTNAGDRILGAGQLGGGAMGLINQAGGLIAGDDFLALIINTGLSTITNAGVIENIGTGGTTIMSAVNNTGGLEVTTGTLTVKGAVSGAGALSIAGGVADLASTFTENVSFTKGVGELELARSQTYTGTVSGFSTTGKTSLDLADIAFATAKASYSGTGTSGTLTVTDGAHTAHIKLAGNFTSATFTLSKDASGGTIVVDPTAPNPASLAGAIASFLPAAPAAGGGLPEEGVLFSPVLAATRAA